jgi:hypothetical protein
LKIAIFSSYSFFFGYSFAFSVQKLIIILVFFFLKNQTLKIIFNWKNKYSIQRTTFENQQFSHLQELFYLWEPFSFELDNWWIDHGTTKVNNACSRTAILFLWNSSSSCSPPCKILHVSVLLAPLYLSSTWHCQFLFFWEHWAMIRTLLISTPYAVICHDSGFKNFAKVHNSKQCHGRWTVSLVLAHTLNHLNRSEFCQESFLLIAFVGKAALPSQVAHPSHIL